MVTVNKKYLYVGTAHLITSFALALCVIFYGSVRNLLDPYFYNSKTIFNRLYAESYYYLFTMGLAPIFPLIFFFYAYYYFKKYKNKLQSEANLETLASSEETRDIKDE